MVVDVKLIANVLMPFMGQGLCAVVILAYLYMEWTYVVNVNHIHVSMSPFSLWVMWMAKVSEWHKALLQTFLSSACKCLHTRVFGFVCIYSALMVSSDMGKIVSAMCMRFALLLANMVVAFFCRKVVFWWNPSTSNNGSFMFEMGAVHYILISLAYVGQKPDNKMLVLSALVQTALCWDKLTDYEFYVRCLVGMIFSARAVEVYYTKSWVHACATHMQKFCDSFNLFLSWMLSKLEQFGTLMQPVCNLAWMTMVIVANFGYAGCTRAYAALKAKYDARQTRLAANAVIAANVANAANIANAANAVNDLLPQQNAIQNAAARVAPVTHTSSNPRPASGVVASGKGKEVATSTKNPSSAHSRGSSVGVEGESSTMSARSMSVDLGDPLFDAKRELKTALNQLEASQTGYVDLIQRVQELEKKLNAPLAEGSPAAKKAAKKATKKTATAKKVVVKKTAKKAATEKAATENAATAKAATAKKATVKKAATGDKRPAATGANGVSPPKRVCVQHKEFDPSG